MMVYCSDLYLFLLCFKMLTIRLLSFSIIASVVGRRPQGTLLGWFASVGSLARMFFPVMSGYVTTYSSINTLFGVLTGVLILSTFFVLRARGTLTLLSS